MSAVAKSKISMIAMQNKEMPIECVLDVYGNTNNNPNEALKGSLVQIGGIKGTGQSLIVIC